MKELVEFIFHTIPDSQIRFHIFHSKKIGQFNLNPYEKTPLKSFHSTRIKISNDVLPRNNNILSNNIFSHIFL
jgi:hypothetical protein